MNKPKSWILLSLVAILSTTAARLLSQGDSIKTDIAIAMFIGAALILAGAVLDIVRRPRG